MPGKLNVGYDGATVEHFRAVLVAQKVGLEARIHRNGSPVSIEELVTADEMDRAQIATRHHVEMEQDNERLRDVLKALRRVEDGSFGICTDCGATILLARLEAISVASRCVSCQAKKNSPVPMKKRR